MEFKNKYITKELDESLLRSFLDYVIGLFRKYNIEQINIAFKYAWGNFINNWEYFEIDINGIKPKIENAEKEKSGFLGEDDLFLHIEEYDTELQFCHHGDLHFGFNADNDFIRDILTYWKEHDISYSK